MRLVSLLIALFALSACGGDNGSSSAPETQAPQSTTWSALPTPAPTVPAVPSVAAEHDPLREFELTGIGYDRKEVTSDGREEWHNDHSIGVPVMVVKDGKVLGARNEDGSYSCDIVLDAPYRLTPAAAMVAFRGMASQVASIQIGKTGTFGYTLSDVKVGELTCKRFK